MKPIVLLLALLALCASATAQTRINAEMVVDTAERHFIVSIPTGAAPAGGYPIVFMFHGTSQNGEIFYEESQWKEKGESEKFITVFPTALRYCIIEDGEQRTTTKWVNGELEEITCPGQPLKDDTRFVRAMLDTIMKTFPIDRSRIYASGFSNGAGFTSKLAVEMSDVFAAAAYCGGGLSDGDSAVPKEKIPLWFVLGTRDDKWLQRFTTITEFPFNDSTLVYMRGTLRRHVDVFGLDTVYTKDSIRNTLTYRFTTPTGSGPTTEFRFTLVNNMFHVYPNGNNNSLVAANIFWEFFQQHTLLSSVQDLPSVGTPISMYPNPASDYITVDGEGEMTLSLRTVLGEQVFTTSAVKGTRIQLPRLASGMYIADVSTGNAHSVSMIVLR